MTAAAIDIRPIDLLDPAEESVARAWIDVHAAIQREVFGDRGSPFSLEEVRSQHRSPTGLRVCRAAWSGGRVVGALEVRLPTRDNLTVAMFWLSVVREARRHGVGSALLMEAEAVAAGHGRRTFLVESEWAAGGTDVAETFVTRRGYAVAQTTLRSEMSLERDPGMLRTAVGQAGAEDYVLESFVDRMPRDWLEQRALLQQRMSTDAPSDDLELEEEAWDAARLDESLSRSLESGRRIVETVARHVPSGDLVGFTQAAVSANDPTVAYQQDTLVLSEHRGHALGLRLKAANALLLRQALPAVRSVRTWNSATNEHMLSVNRKLGYVVDGYLREWQKTVR